jgi:vacuolar iron transporter family protein
VGAIIPVLPFIFWSGTIAIVVSLIFGAAELFVIGAGITLFTGHPVLNSGMRHVLFGLAAAAITYLIGRVVGVNIG